MITRFCRIPLSHLLLTVWKNNWRFGINRKIAFCLGDGKNFMYLSKLNAEQHFFETIVPLPHPALYYAIPVEEKTGVYR